MLLEKGDGFKRVGHFEGYKRMLKSKGKNMIKITVKCKKHQPTFIFMFIIETFFQLKHCTYDFFVEFYNKQINKSMLLFLAINP